ncbi:hypothetical protein [Brevibacterium spongiae]|uniref:DUF3263 domain-containing protein n=1 Tax=Brevibacterium spongiae TaxID=2909672 RepID=A0ABY5SSQ9_9MICO|nr:hypothetical protein [Brevibacterium spongiae]UVI36099.1 hypothetical protein L1F31_00055 [Brevibacterium spongiae]
MTKFVLAYNKRTAELDVLERFGKSKDAVRRRMQLAETHVGSEWELAVLTSQDEDTLRSTHQRYFAASA